MLKQTEMFYIFSFVPETQYDEIKDSMGNLKHKVSFAKYIPDMFSYSSFSDEIFNSIFSQII